MFKNLNNILYIDLSHFDSSKISDMSYMLHECNSLNSLNLNNLETSKVTDM